jgi:hypothetical protein
MALEITLFPVGFKGELAELNGHMSRKTLAIQGAKMIASRLSGWKTPNRGQVLRRVIEKEEQSTTQQAGCWEWRQPTHHPHKASSEWTILSP